MLLFVMYLSWPAGGGESCWFLLQEHRSGDPQSSWRLRAPCFPRNIFFTYLSVLTMVVYVVVFFESFWETKQPVVQTFVSGFCHPTPPISRPRLSSVPPWVVRPLFPSFPHALLMKPSSSPCRSRHNNVIFDIFDAVFLFASFATPTCRPQRCGRGVLVYQENCETRYV